MKLHIASPALLCAVQRFTSTEEVRYYLQSVQIEKCADGGLLYIATDGHRMAIAHDAKGELGAKMGNSVLLDLGRKALPAAFWRANSAAIDGNVMTDDKGNLHPVRACDGAFPDWRRALPGTVSGETAQFNAGYLGDFHAVGKKAGLGAPEVSHNGNGPAWIHFDDNRFVGVLMPTRGARGATHNPYVPGAYVPKAKLASAS